MISKHDDVLSPRAQGPTSGEADVDPSHMLFVSPTHFTSEFQLIIQICIYLFFPVIVFVSCVNYNLINVVYFISQYALSCGRSVWENRKRIVYVLRYKYCRGIRPSFRKADGDSVVPSILNSKLQELTYLCNKDVRHLSSSIECSLLTVYQPLNNKLNGNSLISVI